ncbi:unnamed protein product, partial [Heterosigma akashiwo]
VLIYIDDIIIYSSDINEHMDLLLMVLDRFLDRNLIINLEKSHFLLEQIKYLGHVVDADGIRPDISKIQIIHNTRPPENISELKTFLGLVGFYRDYLPRLSEFAAPLWELDKKDVVWDWSPRHQKAFEDIKNLIGEHTMMTHFDSDLDVEVYSDASDVAICFIISQKGQMVMSYHRKLTDTETRYAVIERELLALVEGVKRHRPYLFGRPITCYTDHK